MKVGFIGAGKAGCSMGKYFSEKCDQGLQVTGYYSLIEEEAKWAAEFTNSKCFDTVDELITASDTIVLSTPDGAIKNVWETIEKDNITGRIFCHLSGSLSSDVFSGIENYGAYPISIHPMFAFSDKESVYQQLHKVSFTLEGHSNAVERWKEILHSCGNAGVEIKKDVKPKYHAAASMLSNHVIAVLEAGYRMLVECGFSEEEARTFSRILVQSNVEHVIETGSVAALTGPVERGDVETVKKHISVLDSLTGDIYRACGNMLLDIAQIKNPERDYKEIAAVLDAM